MIRRKRTVPEGPQRPPHHGEDQNVRVPRENTQVDHPTEVDTVPADLGYRVPPMEPIPVTVVSAPPQDQRSVRWRGGTYSALAVGQEVAGADRRRSRMVVHNNHATDSVLLYADRESATRYNSFTLRAGQDIEFLHNGRVWVSAIPGGTELPDAVSVLIEYSDRADG